MKHTMRYSKVDLLMLRFHGLTLFLALPITCFAAPPFPGGVLDSTGRTAYLASEAGIDAVELARGDLVWQSREAHVPLLVAGDRLYGLALADSNRLGVVGLDLASKAKRVFRAEITDLPRWVTTRSTLTQSFRCQFRQSRNTLLLDWEAESRPAGSPAKHAAGQVQVDLETGSVEPIPVAVSMPRAADLTPTHLEKLAIRWQGRAGGQLLVVASEELPGSKVGDRKHRLILRGWDARSGQETTAPRELLRGSRLVVFTDLDGARLWLRDAAGTEDRPWSVVSSLDGHLIRRVPFVPGTKQATLLGSRAYCLVVAPARGSLEGGPRRAQTLHAVDLEAGKIVWRRELGVSAQAR